MTVTRTPSGLYCDRLFPAPFLPPHSCPCSAFAFAPRPPCPCSRRCAGQERQGVRRGLGRPGGPEPVRPDAPEDDALDPPDGPRHRGRQQLRRGRAGTDIPRPENAPKTSAVAFPAHCVATVSRPKKQIKKQSFGVAGSGIRLRDWSPPRALRAAVIPHGLDNDAAFPLFCALRAGMFGRLARTFSCSPCPPLLALPPRPSCSLSFWGWWWCVWVGGWGLLRLSRTCIGFPRCRARSLR